MKVMGDADAGRLVKRLMVSQPTDDLRVSRDFNARELDDPANLGCVPFLADTRIVLALANAELARRII